MRDRAGESRSVGEQGSVREVAVCVQQSVGVHLCQRLQGCADGTDLSEEEEEKSEEG